MLLSLYLTYSKKSESRSGYFTKYELCYCITSQSTVTLPRHSVFVTMKNCYYTCHSSFKCKFVISWLLRKHVLLPGKPHGRTSLVGWVAEGQTRLSDFTFTFHFHALEKEMATHSSVLALRISGMGEPGGLPSMGSHRVGHDWSDLAAAERKHVLI